MKERKRIFVVILILLSLIYSPWTAFAQEEILTLDNAKELALQYSTDLRLQELNTEKMQTKFNQASESYDKAIGNSYYSLLYEYSLLQTKLASGDTSVQTRINALEREMDAAKKQDSTANIQSASTSKREAKNAYDDALLAENNYKDQLSYLVEQLYTSILNTENSLAALENSYEHKLMLTRLERTKLKFGLSKQETVDKLAIEASNANNTLQQQNNSLKNLKLQLKDMLNLDKNSNLKLLNFEVSSASYIPVYKDVVQKIEENYPKLTQMERDLEQQINDLNNNISTDSNKTALQEAAVEENKISIQKEELNLQLKTNNLFIDFLNKQKALHLAEISYKGAENNYKWAEKKYELGFISKAQYLQEQLNYNTAKKNWFSAGYDFFLVQHSLELAQKGILVN